MRGMYYQAVAQGGAHPGLLQLPEEMNIIPYVIAGTSAGALYAAGKTPQEIPRLMKNNSYFGRSNTLWNKTGFFR